VRAGLADQADDAFAVAEGEEVLAQEAHARRRAVKLVRQADVATRLGVAVVRRGWASRAACRAQRPRADLRPRSCSRS
jgi:hypothetical protein